MAGISGRLDSFQAGGVVVWALSNDETVTSGDLMAALPSFDHRLQGAWVAAANGYFEVDGSGDITKAVRLSAACGMAASYCLAGDGTTTAANAVSDTSYAAGTGTSYVAPQIAGTVALLAEAFPDLTPEEWTKRLLASADNSWFRRLGVPISGSIDYGNGVSHAYSSEWGHGVLDIAAALSLIGSVSVLSGDNVISSSRTDIDESVVATPNSFGDGLENALAGEQLAVFDALNRSYAVQGSALVTPQVTPILPGMLQDVSDTRWGALPSRRDILSNLPEGSAEQSGASISMLKTPTGLFETSATAAPKAAGSVFSLGGESLALTATHRNGSVAVTAVGFAGVGQADPANVLAGTGVNVSLGDESRVNLGLSLMSEEGSLLGLARNDAFNWGDGATIGTIHLSVDHELASGLQVFGRLEHGMASRTGTASGLVSSLSAVQFSSFELGARMESVFTGEDALQVSVNQPLRIESGTMNMQVPTGRTAEGQIENRQVSADLGPSGRELDLSLNYEMAVGEGKLHLGVQYSLDAGHVRDASAAGVAVGFGQRF
ncbi:S8 family serine peptidase [Devosia submarina]|uniref:S8 family serine peptidase n=1 Tax=Devosia submarina TaxID=1173082 RepID=UPI000D3529DB|nr:S8 family serine peptidase [Devosia submarina]